MSWARFSIVAVITVIVMVPLTALALPVLEGLDEPITAVLVAAVAIGVFFVVDRLFIWVVGRLESSRRPGGPDTRA